ncbi:hypothetical protein Scep_014499 [Stephania cephalantha]|uniref:Uncharacterized protein n=1 Tax=Stephania cephalantha TaxID=152367 RepID=A0AAP0J1F6_9MAGN
MFELLIACYFPKNLHRVMLAFLSSSVDQRFYFYWGCTNQANKVRLEQQEKEILVSRVRVIGRERGFYLVKVFFLEIQTDLFIPSPRELHLQERWVHMTTRFNQTQN